jgi:hypothetical protein
MAPADYELPGAAALAFRGRTTAARSRAATPPERGLSVITSSAHAADLADQVVGRDGGMSLPEVKVT